VISSSGRSRIMSLVPMRRSCRWRNRRKARKSEESSDAEATSARSVSRSSSVEGLRRTGMPSHREVIGMSSQQIGEHLTAGE
jgi:hypothetical protein